MQESDLLHRYVFNSAHVRGEWVRLQSSYQQILAANDYPEPIKVLLGELLAATCLLTATLKFEGEIALQLQSEGAVKYAVINGDHQQNMRGVARWDESIAQLPDSFADLFSKGILVITITPSEGERYQGMVAIDKDSLAACIETYFNQSEQLPTKVLLHTQTKDKPQAAGMLLQVLPTSSEATVAGEHTEFEHLVQLTQTVRQDELFELSTQDLLYRLYHQEEVEIFTPQKVQFHCSCSREKSRAALTNIDLQELLDIVAQEGSVKMDCHYCARSFEFDRIDIESLHSRSQQNQQSH